MLRPSSLIAVRPSLEQAHRELPPGVRPVSPGTQPGQVLVIFALCLVVLLGMAGLVIDLGYSFHVQRMLQAAADAGAVAGAQVVDTQTGSDEDDAAVYSAIQSVVTMNVPSAAISAANYVSYSEGTTTVLRAVVPGSTQSPPSSATGLQVSVSQTHRTFFVQVLGIKTLSVGASATAAITTGLTSGGNPQTGGYNPAIIALNPSANHTILNNSSSTLVIDGNIINDSNTTSDSTDSFQTSSFVVEGTLEGVSPQPPDNAFYTCTVQNCPSDPQLYTCTAGSSGCPSSPPAALLANPSAYTCAKRGTASSVECWQTLEGSISYVSDPFANLPMPAEAQAESVCGGTSLFTSGTQTGTLQPGVYTSGGTSPVTITGPATLGDCADGTPGLYYFPEGVIFDTSDGSAITITDSLVFSTGSFSTSSGPGGKKAGIEVEGTGTLTDESPRVGTWEHVALFESRSVSNTSIVFNPADADTGTISIEGTVYTHDLADDSLTSSGVSAGDDIIVGTSGKGGGTGAGTVNIDGTAVCDEFLTYGSGTETITYDANEVPPAKVVLLVG